MLQFIYDFFNSPYIGVILIVWFVLDLLWVNRWRNLLERIATLVRKPWIFTKDPEPNIPPLYPRTFLEQLAQRRVFGAASAQGAGDKAAGGYWTSLRARVFDQETPERAIGHLLFLAFFCFFLLADAISVANTLMVLGVILPGDVPAILQRFDLAVLGGALLAATVSIWMFIEVSGDESAWIDIRRLNDVQKAILKIISLAVAVFSIVVMIAFAIQRLEAIGKLPATPTADIILSAILYGLVPINSALAAAICFPEASRGLIVLGYLLVELALLILPVVAFLLDIIWRAVYVVLDVLVWAVVTPILIVPYGIKALVDMMSPKKDKSPQPGSGSNPALPAAGGSPRSGSGASPRKN